MTSACLGTLSEFLTHGANGVCGPPVLSWAVVGLFMLGMVGLMALWSRRSRSAIFLCLLFALPGFWVIASRHLDEEPIARLRISIEHFTAAHDRCVTIDSRACEACEPVARRAVTPSRTCEHPGVVELQSGALGGHCHDNGDRLLCGPN